MKKFLYLPFVWFILQNIAYSEPLSINIDNPSFRKLIVAVPQFMISNKDQSNAAAQELAKYASEELPRLLRYSGIFNIMDKTAYEDILAKKTDKEQLYAGSGIENLNPVEWKGIGVELLVIGYIFADNDGVVLQVRAVDINERKISLSRRFRKFDKRDYQNVIRSLADRFLETYTGKPGIFNSKITFVGRKSAKAPKQIFISDFDGSNLVQITHGEGPHLSPSWSPDGSEIIFTSYESGDPDLYAFNVHTGKKRRITSTKGLDSGGTWSPDGKLLAFTASNAGDTNIYIALPDGSKRKMLIRGVGLDVDAAFSPDRQWMAFVSGRYGNPHIFRATLKWQGEESVKVVEDKRLTYAGWYNAGPAWSPSSDKIAFAGYDKQTDRFDIFLMNPDGTKLERLTIRSGDNENPAWSPNGLLIAFHSNRVGNQDVKGPAQLYFMKRDGSNQTKAKISLYEVQTPSWSKNVFGREPSSGPIAKAGD